MLSHHPLPPTLRPALQRLLFVALPALLGAGCERVPDPCVDFKLACLAITVPEGPANIRRIQTVIHDGLTQYMQPTPTKPPKEALVYPLRYAVRFGEFENSYRGFVELSLTALNDEYDVVGFVTENVPINGREKKTITLRFGAPPPEPDMAEPSVDMAAPDQAVPADLSSQPDMP